MIRKSIKAVLILVMMIMLIAIFTGCGETQPYPAKILKVQRSGQCPTCLQTTREPLMLVEVCNGVRLEVPSILGEPGEIIALMPAQVSQGATSWGRQMEVTSGQLTTPSWQEAHLAVLEARQAKWSPPAKRQEEVVTSYSRQQVADPVEDPRAAAYAKTAELLQEMDERAQEEFVLLERAYEEVEAMLAREEAEQPF